METLAAKFYRSAGMTLIEVLVALAIVAIALTAVIKASSQNIRGTTYLQNKTMAMWVGKNVLNEVRVGLIQLPSGPDTYKSSTMMLGREWHYSASLKRTANAHIRKIEVKVFDQANDEEEPTPLIDLEGFLYHEE